MNGAIQHEANSSFALFVSKMDEPIPRELLPFAKAMYEAGFSDGGRLGAEMAGTAIVSDIRKLITEVDLDD